MYFMNILEDECPNYCIGNNTIDRLNSIPSSENTNVWALRSNSQASITQNEKDLDNRNIVLFLSNKILYFRAQVKTCQNILHC